MKIKFHARKNSRILKTSSFIQSLYWMFYIFLWPWFVHQDWLKNTRLLLRKKREDCKTYYNLVSHCPHHFETVSNNFYEFIMSVRSRKRWKWNRGVSLFIFYEEKEWIADNIWWRWSVSLRSPLRLGGSGLGEEGYKPKRYVYRHWIVREAPLFHISR